jgi:hypothetical protein
MNPFIRYLELLATLQYLNARGIIFGSEENAFYWGSKVPSAIVLFNGLTLIFASETLTAVLGLSRVVSWIALLAICGLALAVLVFLQINVSYLQELRDRIRSDSPEAAAQRERVAWRFAVGSFLLFPPVLFLYILHAT